MSDKFMTVAEAQNDLDNAVLTRDERAARCTILALTDALAKLAPNEKFYIALKELGRDDGKPRVTPTTVTDLTLIAAYDLLRQIGAIK